MHRIELTGIGLEGIREDGFEAQNGRVERSAERQLNPYGKCAFAIARRVLA